MCWRRQQKGGSWPIAATRKRGSPSSITMSTALINSAPSRSCATCDPIRFKDLAAETKLPKDRQQSCSEDYRKAAKSWGVLLQPHVRAADQPKTKIDVAYGDGKGKLEIAAQMGRSIRLLDGVAAQSSELVVWPAPFSLEIQTCGSANANWVPSTHKLTLCYELAEDFAELYRDYGIPRRDSRARNSR